ncbi:MAG: pilus assembly protein [Alphaproteobacteria bacterium]|nr:pilus assembly protein [Alphaproteobacteria bacterium]
MTKVSKPKKVLGALKSLWADKRGSISMMAGLAAVPMVIAGGAAIDYDRAINAKTELMASLDSAVLYASTQNTDDLTVLTTVSKPFVDVNYNNSGDATLQSYAVTAGSGTNTLKATGVVKMNTWFMAAVGITTLSVTASSEALHVGTGRNINLEVSMVLDNTGSMNTSDGSTPNAPITDLKTAAASFVSTVMGSNQTPYYTKIAVIPYNNSVNLGSASLAAAARGAILTNPSTSTTPGYSNFKFTSASNQTMTYPSSNCVTERQGAQAYTDAAMSTAPVGLMYGPPGYNDCSVVPMVPLSTDKTALVNTINSMAAGQSTAGQVGIAWGWYALSPNVGIWSGTSVPSGYDKLTTTDAASKVKKIMVLMTDGEYNSAYCNGVISYPSSLSGSGSYSYQIPCSSSLGNSYTQATSMCGAIKQSGVEVYVITFQLNTSYTQRVSLVNSCATDASHILNASNQSQLNNVFQSLAQNLVSLRLTN